MLSWEQRSVLATGGYRGEQQCLLSVCSSYPRKRQTPLRMPGRQFLRLEMEEAQP